jgi:hypothetical protein
MTDQEALSAIAAAADAIPGATVEWGWEHSQGIKWESSERTARMAVQSGVERDHRSQYAYQRRNRLVARVLGPVVVIENPHAEVVSS